MFVGTFTIKNTSWLNTQKTFSDRPLGHFLLSSTRLRAGFYDGQINVWLFMGTSDS